MTPAASDVDPRTEDVSSGTPALRRERVVVRRRRGRSRHRTGRWQARVSRATALRAFAVCAGVLVLMAVGLYLGLARQELPPSDGSRAPAPRLPAVAG